MNESAANVVYSKSQSIFPDPSILSEDLSMVARLTKDRELHANFSAARFALDKEDPDVEAARFYIGQGIRLTETAAASYFAASKVQKGMSRYHMADHYFSLARPLALAKPADDWKPSSIVEPIRKIEKAAAAQIEANMPKKVPNTDSQSKGNKRPFSPPPGGSHSSYGSQFHNNNTRGGGFPDKGNFFKGSRGNGNGNNGGNYGR